MKSITTIALQRKKGLLSAFVLTAALAALLTMATALSVTDFLQLIIPVGDVNLKVSSDTNPVMRLIGGVYDILIAQGPARALLLYALLLFALYGLKNIFSYLSAVFFARIKVGILRDIRNGLHRSVLGQDFSRWSSQAQGQWLSRMSNDTAEYETNVLDSIQMIVSSVLTMFIYIAMLLYLNWRLTLIVVAVMTVGTLLLSASRRLKRESRKLQALNGELMSTTQETIDSLKEIKAATAIDYVNDRQQRQNSTFTQRRIAIYRRIYAASPLSDLVGNIIVVAILIVGAAHTVGSASSTMPPALFVSYIMIYVLLLTPIKDFSNAIAQLKKGRGVEERISEACSSDNQCSEDSGAEQPSSIPVESIELRNVSFAYGENSVFNALSLSLPMHRHIAVTGHSGSGKTTFGRLLVGLLRPKRGDILINGCPSSSAGHIAYIPQEPMLFNGTIEDNIRFGRQWVTDNDVKQAVKVAQVEPILQNHPDGLQTNIGDGGSLLSGGEKQRVNIARALAGNPDVVVMDEATAALDAATEQRLTDAIHLIGDRTFIVIAHRASTIAGCDTQLNLDTIAAN